ncbi:GTPase HflX [Halorubrum sp. Ib24]|uniref:GTPase HflX n=1 Tax=Halorubrum sp. Ib24 TaxID=1383850 RepID=UPI000B991294|nr:GTPase HflX [Halorubrum sp. Ib24]OYR40369.1 GTPase HflX [Halorubrum sp. Ib24]
MSRDEKSDDETRDGTDNDRRRTHRLDAGRALIAARDADVRPETDEIRGLARSAGYEVVGEVTQRRREDPTYGLGRGKAEELMRRASIEDVDAVIYDGELSPGQTASLSDLLPDGVEPIDRTRLVLDLFAEGAGSRAAELQVELARLEYLKPRLRELIARDYATDLRYHNEDDRRVLDVERRIDDARRALSEVTEARSERREQRRRAGFDAVALAGYTNAGKSTLLRRLADDVDGPGTHDDPGTHADIDDSVSAADRPFETLDVTTRRATLGGRRTLVTDTVGFVDALPHRSVRSFRATIESVRDADAVLLVVDAADDPETVGDRVRATLSAVEETAGPVVPVLNKVDLLDGRELRARREALTDAAADLNADGHAVAEALEPAVPASALTGAGVDAVREALRSALPTEATTLRLPNSGAAQALLSWAHDSGEVRDVTYAPDGVTVAFAGRPSVVAEAERRAADLR